MHARWLAGLLLALHLGVSGCLPESDPNVVDVDAAGFPAHSTTARLAADGTIAIGITGNEVDEDGAPAGFEVELGKMIAGALGTAAHEITWIQSDPAYHERLIEDREVDLVIAAMPITERSLEIVDFAGPYHVGAVATLTAATENDAERVCATPDVGHLIADTAITGSLADCVEQLRAGAADAVVAPDLVLAAEASSHLVLDSEPPDALQYGIGLAKGDDEWRTFVNDVLETVAADGRWETAWAATAEPDLGPAEPPPVDRY